MLVRVYETFNSFDDAAGTVLNRNKTFEDPRQSSRTLPLTYSTKHVCLLQNVVCSLKNYEARIITELRKFLWTGHPP